MQFPVWFLHCSSMLVEILSFTNGVHSGEWCVLGRSVWDNLRESWKKKRLVDAEVEYINRRKSEKSAFLAGRKCTWQCHLKMKQNAVNFPDGESTNWPYPKTHWHLSECFQYFDQSVSSWCVCQHWSGSVTQKSQICGISLRTPDMFTATQLFGYIQFLLKNITQLWDNPWRILIPLKSLNMG